MAHPLLDRDPTAVAGLRIAAFAIDVAISFGILMVFLIPAFDRYAETYPASEYRCRFRTFDTGDPAGRKVAGDDPDDLCVRVGDELRLIPAEDTASFALQFYGLIGLLGLANQVVLQSVTGGSIGKLALGIRVVREDGRKAGFGAMLLRWLLLFVDLFCCLLGLVLMLSTRGHRRLGDFAANTYVVATSDVGSPVHVPGVTPWPPAAGPAPAARAEGGEGPIWDDARDTYIQWDPDATAWLEWDRDAGKWKPIDQ